MLKSVSFQNFILYRDYHNFKLHEGANFFIGANGSGKSSIYELIRRCLARGVNHSTSNIHNRELPAFVICEYKTNDYLTSKIRKVTNLELEPNFLYSAVLACQNTSAVQYKVVCISQKALHVHECHTSAEVFVESYEIDTSVTSPGKKYNFKEFILPPESKKDVLFDLRQLTDEPNKHADRSQVTLHLIGVFKESEYNHFSDSEKSKCEKVLDELTDVVMTVFAKRSVDPTQWNQSVERKQEKDVPKQDPNFKVTKKHGPQIILKLLKSEHIDKEKEKTLFSYLVYPQRYSFGLTTPARDPNAGEERSNPSAASVEQTCVVKNDNTDLQTSLLKISDGIVEAKHITLALASKYYGTIIYEDPEKAMHPQMIERLRDLVLRKEKEKVILMSSHHPAILNAWSIQRMFSCKFHLDKTKDQQQPRCYTTVKACAPDLKILSSEDMKSLVFAQYVLFVEGITDKKLLTAIIERIFSLINDENIDEDDEIENNARSKLKITETKINTKQFSSFLVGLSIISQNGNKYHNSSLAICEALSLPHMHVYDRDVFVKYEGAEKSFTVQPKLEENYQIRISTEFRISKSEDFQNLHMELANNRIFMWEKGEIEDVIMAAVPEIDLSIPSKKQKKKTSQSQSKYNEPLPFSQAAHIKYVRPLEKKPLNRYSNEDYSTLATLLLSQSEEIYRFFSFLQSMSKDIQ